MKKVKKISICALASTVLIMTMSLSVFAWSTPFIGYLPIHGGDKEISVLPKQFTTSYFTITFTFIGDGTDKVCAWTEGDSTGYNYSSPYTQVGIETKDINYSHVPDIGEKVVLNLDCPVNLDYTVKVEGSWYPN